MNALASAQARALARAEAGRKAMDARKEGNRAADPEFAAWLDDMRSRFGATLTRVEWPDGRTWGAKPEKGRTLNATDGWTTSTIRNRGRWDDRR